MSFLKNEINKVRLNSGGSDHLKRLLSNLKDEIINRIQTLEQADNLRIYDGPDGGVIRGNKKSRKKRENPKTGNLLCQEKYLTDRKLEVPYFKAVFNTPNHSFETPDSIVRIIGSESPLMRKKTDKKNDKIYTRTVSCDLIGLSSDRKVVCIEGKVKPFNKATDIAYGILESYAYGICMEYFFSKSNCRSLLQQEINECIKEYHPDTFPNDIDNYKAAYSLAAPREYFEEYFNPQRLKSSTADELLGEACRLIEVLEKIKGPEWAGFFILEPSLHQISFEPKLNQTVKGLSLIEPFFKCEIVKESVAKNIDQLKKKINSSGASL